MLLFWKATFCRGKTTLWWKMGHTIRRMNYSWTQLISSYHSFCMLGGGVLDGEFRSRSPTLWCFEPYWSFNQFEREAKWNKNWKQVLRFFWLACKTWNKCYVTCICHSCWPAPALTPPLYNTCFTLLSSHIFPALPINHTYAALLMGCTSCSSAITAAT